MTNKRSPLASPREAVDILRRSRREASKDAAHRALSCDGAERANSGDETWRYGFEMRLRSSVSQTSPLPLFPRTLPAGIRFSSLRKQVLSVSKILVKGWHPGMEMRIRENGPTCSVVVMLIAALDRNSEVFVQKVEMLCEFFLQSHKS